MIRTSPVTGARTPVKVHSMSDRELKRSRRPVPSWVVLQELPSWIEERFAVRPSNEWMEDLVSLLQRSTSLVHYRITGLETLMVDFPLDNNEALARCVPWLKVSTGHCHQTVVSLWDQAEFDGAAFTVAGPRQKDGIRSRHPIEVLWSDIRKHIRRQIEQQRQNQYGAAINESSEKKPRHRDRSLLRDWENFWIEVALYAASNGLDLLYQTELRTHMKNWVARNWENPPNETIILARLQGFMKRKKLLDESQEERN